MTTTNDTTPKYPVPPRNRQGQRTGFTTGSNASAAAKAATIALLTGEWPDQVTISLPIGETATMTPVECELTDESAYCCMVKDAGDDPDVTHGALICARVSRSRQPGLQLDGGQGVGRVTLPGLGLEVGGPAINPVPRKMMREALSDVAAAHGVPCDVVVEIGVENGKALAAKTLNGRLGIVGGLSILGTTGIVVPYSCAAWIHAIHRGVDVARAAGLTHVAASTGSTSERAVQALYGLPEMALIDMGDFVGGTLKYVKLHPVPRVTIAGGMGKMTKLAQGLLDLHSKRGSVDREALATLSRKAGGSAELAARIDSANTAAEAFEHAKAEGIPLGDEVACAAQATALKAIAGKPVTVEVVVFDRLGQLVGRAPFTHAGSPR